jgi:hypothetical protein
MVVLLLTFFKIINIFSSGFFSNTPVQNGIVSYSLSFFIVCKILAIFISSDTCIMKLVKKRYDTTSEYTKYWTGVKKILEPCEI